MFLARRASRVTLVVRASLEASMSHYLIQQISKIDNIEVRTNSEVIAMEGDDHLDQLTLCDRVAGTTEREMRAPVRVHRS